MDEDYKQALSEYLADRIELYGQHGNGINPQEYMYDLISQFEESLDEGG